MAKKINGYIKLQVPAGQANPSPPIGPALGQRGLNIMEFCKAFNAATQEMEQGIADSGRHHRLPDQSFTFVTKTPPASYFLKKAAKHQQAARRRPAATSRHGDHGAGARDRRSEDEGPERQRHRGGAAKIIAGSARSMGLEVVE